MMARIGYDLKSVSDDRLRWTAEQLAHKGPELEGLTRRQYASLFARIALNGGGSEDH
jgi:hypothetical protein